MIQLHATTPRPPSEPQRPHAGTSAVEDAPSEAETAAAPDDRVEPAGDVEHAEAAQIRELKARDRDVRQHERAHAAAAAGLPHGAPSFTYTRGPDGRLYATGGEVSIDTSPVPGDPQATIDKARQIQRAALAPAEPSAQDRAVAARAAAMAAAAQAELQQQRDGGGERESVGDDAPAAAAEETAGACAVCGAKHSASVHLEGSYGEVRSVPRGDDVPLTRAVDAVA